MLLPVSAAAVLAIAALLDYAIGDPWSWPHPVQVMGWAISRYRDWVLQRPGPLWQQPWVQRLAGIGLGLGLMGLSGLVGWLMVWGAGQIHPLGAIALNSIVVASGLAGRSLRSAAEEVLTPLATSDLDQARTRLARYVGRDTQNLSEPELLRAVLETVTENATDGVMAPLFYAIVGAWLPVGSASLVLAYKAASTLDSMVGYRDAPYTYLGWFSARFEDGLTWLPCRLTVLTLALLSGRPAQVWQLCWRDARQDPSPNAGWSECAYAAVLGVQVGGINTYRGIVKAKPLLADPQRPITPAVVRQAMGLTRYCVLGWLAIALLSLIGYQLWI